MKKFSYIFISLLLAFSLLTGCAGAEVLDALQMQEESRLSVDFDRFEDIEYTRPDCARAEAVLDELCLALEKPLKFGKVNGLIDEFYVLHNDFDTMHTVAYIRSCLDMSDEFYAAEYSWLLEADVEMQNLVEQLYTACANSSHAFWLEKYKFWDGFAGEYEEASEDDSADEYMALARQEAALLTEYRSIVANPSVEIDGYEWLLYDYIQQAGDYGYAVAYEAYYEKYTPILGQLYIELMSLRSRMAELMGYDSYAAMCYEQSFGRDYSPEDAEKYMAYVKTYLAPLGRELVESGVYYQLYYEALDSRDLRLILETAAEGFGGVLCEAYEFMAAHMLYDFERSSDKAESSFQAYISGYEAPYLFLYPYGDTGDIITLMHEFGHYADSYIRRNAYSNIDLSECFSHAMQFLALEPLSCVFSEEEIEQLHLINLMDIVDALLQQCALAEFELLAYEMEEPTVEKLNALCLQLSRDYGFYDEFYEQGYSYFWLDTSHLFEVPNYVISYPVSASVALEIYERELESEGAGREMFIEMSESCLAGLDESLELVGLHDPMSEERVKATADFLRRSILE